MSETNSAAQPDSMNNSNHHTHTPTGCTPPTDIFTMAGAIALIFYKEFTPTQLLTLVNLLTLVLGNLSALITQTEINKGEQVEPPF